MYWESNFASQWLDFDFPLSNLSSTFKTIDLYLGSVSDSKASLLDVVVKTMQVECVSFAFSYMQKTCWFLLLPPSRLRDSNALEDQPSSLTTKSR